MAINSNLYALNGDGIPTLDSGISVDNFDTFASTTTGMIYTDSYGNMSVNKKDLKRVKHEMKCSKCKDVIAEFYDFYVPQITSQFCKRCYQLEKLKE